MVVPPAIAITFMFYVKRTSEVAVFWSISAGFFGGLSHWGLNTLFANAQHQNAGGFGQTWYEFSHMLGEWSDPTFSATLIPLAVIIIFIIVAPERKESAIANKFYADLGRP